LLGGALSAVFILLFLGGYAQAMDIQPFQTRNQLPLVQIFGLPPAEGGVIRRPGETTVGLLLDAASVFSDDDNAQEKIYLDGEIYRLTFAVRHGLAGRWEAGLDIPYVWHTGGELDGFIDGFHRTFDLPEGGRQDAARDNLRYFYARNGETALFMEDSQNGLGDLLLSLGLRLTPDAPLATGRSLALRAGLKLPTGEADKLTGSDSTDFSLRLCGSDSATLAGWDMTLFGTLGALAMSQGEVLADLQRRYVAFGTVGIGWEWVSWLALQLQFDGHTAFFRDSTLCPLDTESIQITVGGVFDLPGGYRVDLGIVEDLLPTTAPDVVFHLAVRRHF